MSVIESMANLSCSKPLQNRAGSVLQCSFMIYW